MNARGNGLQKQKADALGLLRQNRLEEALGACRRICDSEPGNAENWYVLATVHGQLGQLNPAADCYRRTTELQPDFLAAHCNLGQVLQRLTRYPEAESSYRKAVQLRPDDPGLLLTLGNLLFAQGKVAESESCYAGALRLKPDYTEAWANLGKAQQSQGQFSEAEKNFRKAVEIQPDSFDSYNELGMSLSGQGNLDKAIQAYRKALALKPDFHVACSNLLLTLNYTPGYTTDQIFAEHRNQGKTAFRPIRRFGKYRNTPDHVRRLRIGYVSADFRDHSVAHFFETLPTHHNHEKFEIICYSDVSGGDSVTRRLKKMSDGWRSICGQPNEKVAELIHGDQVDLLVDLSGHTAHNRLPVFASRPAPVQISYLGYPNTTGLTEIDYRLTDRVADPEGNTEAYFTEKLIRLPGCFLCYTPPEGTIPAAICPSEKGRYVTFGSFNNFTKMTTEVLEVWASLLNSVPDSRLLLKNFALSDPQVREHCYSVFEQFGVHRDRLELHDAVLSKGEHLKLYERIDVGLDTFPYNGTTTTCEALWMGVPVIVLEGDRHAGRVGASLMSTLDLRQLIAHDKDEYCSLAASLADNIRQRRKWRTSLRNIMEDSPLCDGPAFVRNLESAYRDMWSRWCANHD
ncbi:MAG: tetratricopeptide repeat protein [Thiogranum sp.]